MVMRVVCGILIWNDKILIGKRKPDNPNFPDKWELPGGKVEPGETDYDAIVREFKEELDIDVQAVHELKNISDDEIQFIPWVLRLVGGKAKLNEHSEIKFVSEKEFFEMDLTKYSREVGKTFFRSYTIFLRKENS